VRRVICHKQWIINYDSTIMWFLLCQSQMNTVMLPPGRLKRTAMTWLMSTLP
jgi:hypothetical protein